MQIVARVGKAKKSFIYFTLFKSYSMKIKQVISKVLYLIKSLDVGHSVIIVSQDKMLEKGKFAFYCEYYYKHNIDLN